MIIQIQSKRNTKLQHFYVWLAGMIDGDGYLYVKKKKNCGLEITVPYQDEALLIKIKQCFGGSIKPRSGSKSVRYRLHNKNEMIKLVSTINGLLYNHIRQNQLKLVLDYYGLVSIPSAPFTWESSYVSGLFDSDGTVTIGVKKHNALSNLKGKHGKIERLRIAKQFQLSISITQKYKCDIEMLKSKYKSKSIFGSIYLDKSQNGYYTWYITSREDIFLFLNYITKNPSRSPMKSHRLRMIQTYYNLIDLKAYNAVEHSLLSKRWGRFAYDWFKFSYDN